MGLFWRLLIHVLFWGVGGGGWAGLGGGIPDVCFFWGGINSSRWVNPIVRSKGN